jgi:hypothetical protein
MSNWRAIKITGLKELEEKLGKDFLLNPELPGALASFQKRIARGGKGIGAKRNVIGFSVVGNSVRAHTTLRHPRQSGGEWTRKNQRIIGAMAPRVFAKMARNVEARWAADGNVPPANYSGVE